MCIYGLATLAYYGGLLAGIGLAKGSVAAFAVGCAGSFLCFVLLAREVV